VNLVTADGWAVPIAWNCSPMRNDDGTVRGIVAVGRDLTERRQLEAQLIQSAKMASLGVMAGGIAHELRNPLGIISASAQLLLEHQDDSLGSARDKAYIRHECARKIHAATQRASLIIENLLKFARAQGGRKREVDLHTVLDETLVLLAHQMTLQQVTLRKEWQPDLPRVHGNPEMLQQVFTNIILNACNAMRQGGTLTIATRVAEPGSRGAGEPGRGGEEERGRGGEGERLSNEPLPLSLSPPGSTGSPRRLLVSPSPPLLVSERVEIRFTDTGHGIPPEHLSKIFDPFFTTMPVGKGTGLGLSISYGIIQQHEGTIEVESQPGAGTTFTVRLPALRASLEKRMANR
jgi:signal transduction histidine kinase